MSVFHFCRRFRHKMGVSPNRYITRRRIERARHLLPSTELPIGEIAFQVGYSNVSHFTNVFKREIGTTPGRFKAVHLMPFSAPRAAVPWSWW
jgi:AraC family transcriptional regulator